MDRYIDIASAIFFPFFFFFLLFHSFLMFLPEELKTEHQYKEAHCGGIWFLFTISRQCTLIPVILN